MRILVPLAATLICVVPAFGQIQLDPGSFRQINGTTTPRQSTPPAPPAPTTPPPRPLPPVAPTPLPPVGTLGGENLRGFDYRFVELQYRERRWHLQQQGEVIKSFDQREIEAHEAVRLIREFRLTQHGTIGSPQPIMEYWLSNGQAPTAPVAGLSLLAIDHATLRVENFQGRWLVRDARRLYFNFGGNEADARKALSVIQHYGFDRVGFVGQPVPIMVYFLSSKARAELPVVPAPLETVKMREPEPLKSTGLKQVTQASKPETGLIQQMSSKRVINTSLPKLPVGSGSPLPDQGDLNNRLPIDWQQVELKNEHGEWRLQVGTNLVLANLGKDEREAKKALAAMRHYRFTEQCIIGKPDPSLRFFMVNGEAARGLMLGVESVNFVPDKLKISQSGKSYYLSDGRKKLVDVGTNEEDAQLALKTIQKQHCDRMCKIGSGTDANGMRYFVRTH